MWFPPFCILLLLLLKICFSCHVEIYSSSKKESEEFMSLYFSSLVSGFMEMKTVGKKFAFLEMGSLTAIPQVRRGKSEDNKEDFIWLER